MQDHQFEIFRVIINFEQTTYIIFKTDIQYVYLLLY